MIRAWRYSIVRPRSLFIIAECALFVVAISLAAFAQGERSLPLFFRDHLGVILLLVFPQVCSYLSGMDALIAAPDFRLFVSKALSSMVLGLLLTMPFFFLFPNLFPGYRGALAAAAVSAVLPFGLRALFQWMIRHNRFVEGLLILGTGDLARKFYTELAHGNDAAQPVEWGSTAQSTHIDCPQPFEDCGEVIRDFDQLRELMLRNRISRIVVAEPNVPPSEELAIALLDCKLQGFEVEQAIQSYERLNSKIWLEALRPEWLVYSDGFRPPKHYFAVKRVFDFLSAIVLLAITLLPAAVVGLLIKLESAGPVLFRQVRVGLHGKHFVLFKFRTMRADAESATGPVWATAKDARVTRLGKYLRKFRLDEIPQLLNVVRGEMSLVGPRPERPHFVDLLNKHIQYYGLRHSVMPGITGWAQVLYPYGASVKDAYEKLQYDLFYAKHMSLALDLKILLRTVRVVLFGRGR